MQQSLFDSPSTDPGEHLTQDVDGSNLDYQPSYSGIRSDIHRPSAINPADYQYVACECVKIFPGDFGACQYQLAMQEVIRKHMAQTGGSYSGHQHGGNCMVCGSVNAIYTILFYHAKSNTYVRMGADCAEKCEMGADFGAANRFRVQVDNWREAQAGKNKARLLLSDRGLDRAWVLYADGWKEGDQGEEITIRDIVGKLVKYGAISDKQFNFIGVLLSKIESRATREAGKLAEQALLADCPNHGRREWFEGKVLTVRVDDTQFGSVTRMLAQHATGFKIWGTRPSGLNCERGDTVGFSTVITRSDKDPKFGFYSRPTKPVMIDQSAASREV